MSIYETISGLWASKHVRVFTEEEVTDGTWLKLFDHGRGFCLRLEKNGKVEESDLFEPDIKPSSGTWRIEGDGFNERSKLIIRLEDRWEDTVTASDPGNLFWGMEHDEETGDETKCRVVHVPFFRFTV